MDFLITWKYIVEEMQRKFGFSPTNEEKLSYGEFERYMGAIWSDFVDKVKREEKNDELS